MLGFFSAGVLFLRLSVSFQHFVLTAMLTYIPQSTFIPQRKLLQNSLYWPQKDNKTERVLTFCTHPWSNVLSVPNL